MDDLELAFTPATELRELIRSKQVSPVEVVDAALRRIERVNPAVNAYVTVAAEQAVAAARDAEAAIQRGNDRSAGPEQAIGPLHGVPVSLKDLTPSAGIRTTYGSKLFADNVPTADALEVTRLKQAGAIILGKTNTPEFGAGPNTLNALFGATRNPWDLERSAGGSSGGAAVALACGLGPLAQGSDLGGSLRIPASVCGVIGFRTSPGRIPVWPGGWTSNPFSVTGPMARSVRDVALMLSVMAGPDDRVSISLDEPGDVFERAADGELASIARVAGRPPRVAWSHDLGIGVVDPEVSRLVESAARTFESLGCTVEDAHPDIGDPRDMIAALRALGTAAGNPELLKRADEVDNPFLREFLKRPAELTGMEIANAWNAHSRLIERVSAFFRDYDLLITPTTPTPAYLVDQMFPPDVAGTPIASAIDAMIVTYAITMTGLPAISVPAGWTEAGPPIGMQIVGRRHAEAAVLSAAAAFEATRPWADRRPAVATVD